MCGICQEPFDACAPNCTFPGDDCPPCTCHFGAPAVTPQRIHSVPFSLRAGWGRCKHVFHMQCIMKWLESSQDDVPSCPMCRQPWEFAADDAAEDSPAAQQAQADSPRSWSRSSASTSPATTPPRQARIHHVSSPVRAMQLVLDSDDEEGAPAVHRDDSASDQGPTEAEGGSVASMSSSSIDLDLDEL